VKNVSRETFCDLHDNVSRETFLKMASLEKPVLAKTVYVAARVAGFMKNKLLTDTKA
jgi:hypothetical protein